MAKLRHIAVIVPDPEAAATFFEQAFDMKRCGVARRGIHVSDGVVNVALLKKEKDDERIGIAHFGMWVDDLDAAEKKVLAAGGEYLSGTAGVAEIVLRGEVPRPGASCSPAPAGPVGGTWCRNPIRHCRAAA